MSWISVVRLNKPSGVEWWERINSEKTQENFAIFDDWDIEILNEYKGLNQNTVTFIYHDEAHYNAFQDFYANNPIKLEKEQYNLEKNINSTRVYLGPAELYIPPTETDSD